MWSSRYRHIWTCRFHVNLTEWSTGSRNAKAVDSERGNKETSHFGKSMGSRHLLLDVVNAEPGDDVHVDRPVPAPVSFGK